MFVTFDNVISKINIIFIGNYLKKYHLCCSHGIIDEEYKTYLIFLNFPVKENSKYKLAVYNVIRKLSLFILFHY